MATRSHALYRLLTQPQNDAAQGGCYLTGSQGPCVDTGVLISHEGTLTISLGALVELCEVAGFSFNAEARRLEDDLSAAQHMVEALVAEKEDLESQLDAVSLAVARGIAEPPAPKAKRVPAKSKP